MNKEYKDIGGLKMVSEMFLPPPPPSQNPDSGTRNTNLNNPMIDGKHEYNK